MPRTRETPEQTAERRLGVLSAERPELAGLARLQLVVLDALPERGHLVSDLDVTPEVARARLAAGEPWLHGAGLAVAGGRFRDLVIRLAEQAAEGGAGEARALRAAARRGRFEPVEAIGPSLAQSADSLAGLAGALGLPPPLLATVLGLALQPLLLAARDSVGDVPTDEWAEGFCPCCGAWPALGVLEGLDRTRWLACGRCGVAWRAPWQWCPYCGNADHERLGYLQPAASEARRIVTCDVCRGYVKTVTSLERPPLPLIAFEDLNTVDLDLAALARNWRRPDPPGFAVEVAVTAAPSAGGWKGLSSLLRGSR